jgi:hypothetical protein
MPTTEDNEGLCRVGSTVNRLEVKLPWRRVSVVAAS